MKTRVSGMAIVTAAALAWAAAGSNHALPATPAAGAMRIGVVDLVRVFNEFEQTRALNAELERYKLKIAEQKQEREDKLTTERATLQGFAPDSADYHQRSKDFKKLMIDYQAWLATEREFLDDEHRRWIELTYKALVRSIAAVAREANVQVVLTREELDTNVSDINNLRTQILNRKVVYYDPSLDVTDTVLANLNAEFAKSGGAKSIKFGS